MKRKAKFWLLFIVGFCIFIPPFLFTIITQVIIATLSLYGILFATQFLVWFFLYFYLIYRSFYRGAKTKYPLVPPEGRMSDHYFPRTRIPRPIYEDARRYPESFKRKRMKTWEKRIKVKNKS